MMMYDFSFSSLLVLRDCICLKDSSLFEVIWYVDIELFLHISYYSSLISFGISLSHLALT